MNSVQLSKLLTWLLRHTALEKGLNVDSQGYIKMDDILKLPEFDRVDVAAIEEVVKNNSKDRFRMDKRNDTWFIRANQGHSIVIGDKLVDNKMMIRVDLVAYPVAYHGTSKEFFKIIQKEGINPMARKHVHMSKTYKKDNKANNISGIRGNAQIILEIDLVKATKSGIKFYESDNGVILTESIIKPEYFVKF